MHDENPYASPASSGQALPEPPALEDQSPGVYREGDLLVLDQGAVLPDICLRTNLPAYVRWNHNLYWAPSWVAVGIPFGLLPFLILHLLLQRSATVSLPFAPRIWMWRRIHIGIAVLLIVGGFYGMFCYAGLPGGARLHKSQDLLIFGGVLAVIAGCLWAAFLAPLITTHQIDDRYVWLRGAHPDYLARWPHFRRPYYRR